MLSQSFPIGPADAMEASVAAAGKAADSAMERAERARAMRMMGIYLEDAQGKRDEASSRRADQLTAVIRECVESLAANPKQANDLAKNFDVSPPWLTMNRACQ